ncbi:YsnF/AvaK domain-containing protein [Planctomyces sp. SH-PL62]|uniref:YsnF/AvaK domain-containing protein n=1 Tax=Planctomyces sp. SH-PL62 TaxID=1636152 RepID=UPI00078BAE89|nr:YsnF/AvaK domain-containing protein [Planctomyces sp. SH-PL62]AMV39519.1 Stress response protein YsnF [Planctomyces sp. SH-PL62]
MTTRKDPEKSIDVPPTGSRNPDPITDAPGSHPVETGIGAAIGGIASGAAIGSVAGPIGTAVGAALGAVAGGLAGKGMGELIDPTTEDNWLRESFPSRPYAKGQTYEAYEPAYKYAGECETKHAGKAYSEVESDLQKGWDKTKHATQLSWDKAKGAVKDVFDYRSANRYAGDAYDQYEGRPFTEVEHDLKAGWGKTKHAANLTWDRARDTVRDAYDRTIQLREERLKVSKHPVETGDVSVRKEVVTENKTVTVPVEREEIVIERHPVSGRATAGGMGSAGAGTEEVRIPVKREEIEIGKETVVTDEVSVGKRKVQGTEKASGTVRKEELKVEKHGDVDIDDKGGKPGRR